MPNNILFLTAVHGDENIGIEVMRKLEEQVPERKFSWIIANPKALKKRKRFVDIDMNRSAPGSKSSKKYEERRVCEIMNIARSYDFVIDLHGTVSKTGIFIIIPNPKLNNFLLAAFLKIKNVIIWRPTTPGKRKGGPIAEFVKCGLGIECGIKSSAKIKKQLFETLKSFLKSGPRKNKKELNSKRYFKVYGKIKVGEISQMVSKKLKNFKKIRIGKESFYPIFVGGYKKDGIICYKMKKINFKELRK